VFEPVQFKGSAGFVLLEFDTSEPQEMPFLFRTGVLISRKQPFIAWANGLQDGFDFPPELARKRDMYLGPHSELQQTLEALLDQIWNDIFDEELFGWSTEESQWPAERTRKMFDEWFDAELVDSIIDLVPDDPLTEDDMDLLDLDDAMSHCAWCERELEVDDGRMVTCKLSNRDLFEHREGRIILLAVGSGRSVAGLVTPRDSEPARENADVIFRACSRACEKRLSTKVPTALQALEAHLVKAANS